MGNVLISYDVSGKHTQVKAALKGSPYNYHDAASLNNVTINLPNTTLWKPNTTAQQAKQDIVAVTKANSVRLERAVAVEFNNMDSIPGDPHAR